MVETMVETMLKQLWESERFIKIHKDSKSRIVQLEDP